METEMSTSHSEIIQILEATVGQEWVKTNPDDLDTYGRDWTKFFPPDPLAAVLPKNIDEVAAIVKNANSHGFALVPSGGRTGLSGGAVATKGEVVIAFDRMNKILDYSASDRQVICEPGVITEQLQQFAEEKDLHYPVDFASSGSSQIGGNVATNAGGIKVIRYGMTRDWVQGVKVITGNGELLNLNRGLIKNATGYDLRHLFIGSEGTLGLIVEITIELTNPPVEPSVMLLGIDDMSKTISILEAAKKALDLTAFEFFSDKALQHVIEEKNLKRPLENPHNYYTLIEFENFQNTATDKAMEFFEFCLTEDLIADGTMSQSTTQAKEIWRLREDISETISKFIPYKNDISVKVSLIPQFIKAVDNLVTQAYPDFEIIWFGHIGDGNVHLNILKPETTPPDEFYEKCSKVSPEIFKIVESFEGSISAEHGVGLLKKEFLCFSRSAEEISYLRKIKAIFDPKNIMNPGKLIDM
jgi:glycolate oxidase subunit GlcD